MISLLRFIYQHIVGFLVTFGIAWSLYEQDWQAVILFLIALVGDTLYWANEE